MISGREQILTANERESWESGGDQIFNREWTRMDANGRESWGSEGDQIFNREWTRMDANLGMGGFWKFSRNPNSFACIRVHSRLKNPCFGWFVAVCGEVLEILKELKLIRVHSRSFAVKKSVFRMVCRCVCGWGFGNF